MKDTVNVLKRMMDNRLMGDEYNALKEAIDCVKRVEKLKAYKPKKLLLDTEFPENYGDMYWRRINTDDVRTLPPVGEYIMLSFTNCTVPQVGSCEGNKDVGYAFYLVGDDESLSASGIFVNAWMPLPKQVEDDYG